MPVVLANPPAIRTPGTGPNGPGPIDARASVKNSGAIWVPLSERPVGLTKCYVRKTGSDSNGGTSPSDAWLTINKALTTAAAGTIIYVGAGTYRETVSMTSTPTITSPIYLQGDVTGAFTGDAGPVILSAYTTNDITAPSGTQLFAAAKTDLVIQNIIMFGGTTSMITITSQRRVVYRDCAFLQSNNAAILSGTFLSDGLPSNTLFERCYFIGVSGGNASISNSLSITCPTAIQSDFDVNCIFRSCFFYNDRTYSINIGGQASAPRSGGMKFLGCTFMGQGGITANGSAPSAIYKCLVLGCLFIMGANAGAPATNVLNSNGNASGLFEDYNLIIGGGGSGVQNWTNGGHTKNVSYPLSMSMFGIERIYGGMLRLFQEPMAASASVANPGIGYLGGLLGLEKIFPLLPGTIDMQGFARVFPMAKWSPGMLERGNGFTKEISTVQAGSSAISLTGPGYEEYKIPVSAGTITLSVYCQKDSNYSGPPPQMSIVPSDDIGVGDQFVEFSPASTGAFEQKQITINPTGTGVVTVRLISYDASSISKVVFDTFSVQ